MDATGNAPAARFWQGKRVLLTGHTGFKGSWLALWLSRLGAQVTGFALPPPTEPSLFDLARIGECLSSVIADIRDADAIHQAVREAQPEIIFHLAAQPLVRQSYLDPVETYATNVMGLVHLFEAVRQSGSARALVNVTSDKCYENREWLWGYREDETLGGHDPYSNSKACAELVTAAYRKSFFNRQDPPIFVATARAGNVIGGGDWARDRLLPDILNAIAAGTPVRIRHPDAIRPWQHVLEPLRGYLMLAEQLYRDGAACARAWNFGPADEDARPVRWIVERIAAKWPDKIRWEIDPPADPPADSQSAPQ
ncbi:MAG: CDP-glucose 4,6-dehydratase, partial [Candidatus Accumulibacter sp.]|nr:CDP-glucose 4,6-dehydratase [Accumulibacter sp.]